MPKPRIVFLNGPTAAGKTTACRKLLERHAGQHNFAVLERDDFEDFAGRGQVVPGSTEQHHIWEIALPAMKAAAREYLKNGFSVFLVVLYGPRGLARLERSFAKYDPAFVCLLPSWRVNRGRRTKRMDANGQAELDMFGWQGHKEFYDLLVEMSDDGMFDEVVDTSRMSPARIADRLALYLPS